MKLQLKDLIGKSDINILVDVNIKGQKWDSKSVTINPRLLKRVYTKQDKRGCWLYATWEPEGSIICDDKSSFNDCGYSGLLLGEEHPLENLYMETI